MRRQKDTSAIQQFGEAKAEYAAMTDTRFRRRRSGVGPIGRGADAAVLIEQRFIQMREYVRAMDRDDWCIGQLTDRVVEEQTQLGFTLKPNTGDKAIDKVLKGDWKDWSTDRFKCDLSGQRTFYEMEMALPRAEIIDGDVLVVPIEDDGDDTTDGRLELIEAHRCRKPSNSKRNIFHGVELDQYRRRKNFWFAPESINPFDDFKRVSEADVRPAVDEDGNPLVLQIYKTSRFSATRGITWFKAVFDIATMTEDTVFATTLKAQLASCVAFTWEKDPQVQQSADPVTGERFAKQLADFTEAIEQGVAPGLMLNPPPGHKLKIDSPQIPADTYFNHVKMLVGFLSIQLGAPLFLGMLGDSDMSFSSWRGVWDMVKNGFRTHQQRRIEQFYTPVYRWRVRRLLLEDPALRAAAKKTGVDIFGHAWNPPDWPYIQPLHDAQANAIRVQTGQASLRKIHTENGTDYEDFVAESVNDNALWIGKAMDAYLELKRTRPEAAADLSWRDLYYRDFYRGGTLAEQVLGPDESGKSNQPVKK